MTHLGLRRFGVALISALMLATSFSHIAAPTASAVIANPITADSSGDPVESFRADDALFAYFTVDITGGDICVVNEDTVAAPGVNCEAGVAWGTPNHFVGFGTQYEGLEAPFLVVGTWRLLAASTPTTGNPNPTPTLSVPFTVLPCADTCDTSIGDAAIAAWKAGAGAATEGAFLACKAMAVQSTIDSVTGLAGQISTMRGILYDAANVARKGVRVGIPTSTAVVVDFAGGLIAVPMPEFSSTEEMAMALLKQLLCSAALMHATIMEDPPDPNFTTVAQPVFGSVPNPLSDEGQALGVSLDRQRAFGEAMLHAFERYLGAKDADQPEFVRLQAQAMADFGFDVSQEMRTSARLLRDYAVTLGADAALVDTVVADQQALNVILGIQERIRQDGFLPEELDELAAEGYTIDEAAQIRAMFDLDFSGLPTGVSIDTFLENTASEFEAAAIDYDAIAREASSVASLTNTAPVASFTALPSSGAVPLDVTFTSTSSDPDGDTLITSWDFGDGSPAATGSPVSHTYTGVGTYTATLTVSDGTSSDSTSTFINVTANHPPVANDDTISGIQDTPATLNVLGNDSDVDGDALHVNAITAPGHGSVTCAPTGSCTYTPVSGYAGTDSFTYTVADGKGGQDVGQVDITLAPADPSDHPPVAGDDEITVKSNSSLFVYLISNDMDPDGDVLTIVARSNPSHGTVDCYSYGYCTYTPDHDYVGTDSFDYTISDGRGRIDTATVSVTIEPNHPPVAVDDSLTLPLNKTRFIDVLANDTDADNDSLAITGNTVGSHGTATCSTGSCAYTPDANYVGPDSFDYTVADGRGGSDSATVAITVEANHPPIAADDVIETFVGHKGNTQVVINDSDPDGDAVHFTSNGTGAHGSVSCSAEGRCVFVPDAGFIGPDTFTYTISDGVGGVATGTVHVTVRPSPVVLRSQSDINAAIAKGVDYLDSQQNPDGSIGSIFTVAETSSAILAYGVLDRGDINNLDADKQAHLRAAIAWLLDQQDPNGAWKQFGLETYNTGLAVSALSHSEGIDPAIPAAIASGRAWLIGAQTAPPSVTGNPITPDCSAADDAYSSYYCGGWNYDGDGGFRSDESNTGFALTGLAASGGVPAATADININWQHHVQELDTNPFAARNDGGGDYQPGDTSGEFSSNANNTGSLIFGYAYDGVPGDNPQAAAAITFGLDVLNQYQLTKDAANHRMITHYEGADEDGICGFGAGCDWRQAGDGGYHYSLWALTKGLGHYIPADLDDGSNWYPKVADLLLGDQNDDGSWPQDSRDDGSIVFATGLAIDALGRVGAPHTLTVTKNGTGTGTVSSAPVGIDCGLSCSHDFSDGSTVTLTAVADAGSTFTGWTGSGCTGTAGCVIKMNASKDVTATFDLESGGNHPPVAGDDTAAAVQDGPAIHIDVLANDTDADATDVLSVISVDTTATDGTVVVNGPDVTYTPGVGFSGTDTFIYTVSDGHGGTDTATVTVTVQANRPPVAVDDAANADEHGPAIHIDVLANDTDADGDSLSVTSADTTSTAGVVTVNGPDVTYDPNGAFDSLANGQTEIDTFAYTISDGHGHTDTATVSVTVHGQNDGPTLDAVSNQIIPEMVLFQSITLAGSDPDGDTLTYSAPTKPAGLTVNATSGLLEWTPSEAQGPGVYNVTVRATDPDGLFAERSFTITVNEVNRLPSLAAIADQTVYPGDAVSLTASGSDPDLPANTLTYSLVSGPSGATVNPTTGAFAWPASSTLGDYPAEIGVSDGIATISRSFTIHVVRDTTTLTLGGDTSGQYSDHATITATLRVGSAGVSGASVSISLGAVSQTATTNASGIASATFTIPGPTGALATGASFAGTLSQAPSSATGTFAVNRENSTILYSGDTMALVNVPLRLSATFTDSAATGFGGSNPESGASATIGDITKARIAFAVYNAATCLSGSPITILSAFVTDTGTVGDGIGTATVNWSSASEGSFCVVTSLVGDAGTGSNGYYIAPPSEPAGLAVYIDTAGKVTGGGWVPIADGRGSFGFNATSLRGPVKGNLVFIERTTYNGKNAILIVKSNAIDALRSSGPTFPISVTLSGKASVKYISAADGTTLFESGNATFTATVVDTNIKGVPSGDSFAIRVISKTGAVLVDLGLTLLGAGNVVAHLK